MSKKPVVLIVANEGYQQLEYSAPKQLLEQAGYKIVTASNKKSPAIAKDGSTTPVDILIQDIKPEQYAGVFFIGGPGTLENLDNDISYRLAQALEQAQIPFGGICHATRVLAHAGVLRGKQATGYNGDNKLDEIYKQNQVTYVKQPVVIDENIVTATDPHAAIAFGKAILSILK